MILPRFLILFILYLPTSVSGESQKIGPDTSFNQSGNVSIEEGARSQFLHLAPTSDGGVLAVGTAQTSGTHEQGLAVKWLPNGKLDTRFNGTGKRQFRMGTKTRFLRVARAGNDRFAISWSTTDGNGLLLIDSQGNPVPGFASQGIYTLTRSPSRASIKGLAAGVDGSIYFAFSQELSGLSQLHVTVGALDSRGAPVKGFGEGGFRSLPVMQSDPYGRSVERSAQVECLTLAYPPEAPEDFRIVVAATVQVGKGTAAVFRFYRHGEPDHAFGLKEEGEATHGGDRKAYTLLDPQIENRAEGVYALGSELILTAWSTTRFPYGGQESRKREREREREWNGIIEWNSDPDRRYGPDFRGTSDLAPDLGASTVSPASGRLFAIGGIGDVPLVHGAAKAGVSFFGRPEMLASPETLATLPWGRGFPTAAFVTLEENAVFVAGYRTNGTTEEATVWKYVLSLDATPALPAIPSEISAPMTAAKAETPVLSVVSSTQPETGSCNHVFPPGVRDEIGSCLKACFRNSDSEACILCLLPPCAAIRCPQINPLHNAVCPAATAKKKTGGFGFGVGGD